MNKTIVHHEGVCSLERTGKKVKLAPAVIKIGLDVHARLYVAVAQYRSIAAQGGAALRAERVRALGGRTAAGRVTKCMWFMKRAGLGSRSTGSSLARERIAR